MDVTQNITRLGSQQKAQWAKELRTETKMTSLTNRPFLL
jgi:hypothetical protein